jgi:hypothetical protein
MLIILYNQLVEGSYMLVIVNNAFKYSNKLEASFY